ncbi:MAG: hypothetical protein IPG38_12025 [Chitinophagaceae bacterium]|nr:hypothetical protein [Chitinophagaceae bacterium]
MTGAIAHRGLDDEGSWSNYKNTVHLGHRRLSVIDLSKMLHNQWLMPTATDRV